jgi:hypothetical protein
MKGQPGCPGARITDCPGTLNVGTNQKTPLFSWRGFFLPRQTFLVEQLEKKKDNITESQDYFLLVSSCIRQRT